MKYSIILLIMVHLWSLIQSIKLRHNMWYINNKKQIAPDQNPFETKRWNFCDLKCYYLQTYYDYDFVVIWFKQHAYRPNFAACYVKDDSTPYGYTIWDQKVSNKFYQKICGMDMEDYLLTPSQYEVIKIEGQGRNNFQGYY